MEINSLNNNGSPNSINRFEELTSEDFMKIMFTELTNQDPLDAQDTKELLNQINSIRSIESNVQLMNQLETLASQNLYAASGNMIGKQVSGLDENFTPVEGVVTAASIEGDRVIFTLESGDRIPMEQIEVISQVPQGV